MQGRKVFSPKLFMNFNLSQRVPEDNFYRRLGEMINLDFIYPLTRKYYGKSGQKSIDPVVFFKLSLAGYLENIISDRQLMKTASMRMDILYFLDYDIDEPLPWHSALSRTRAKLPTGIFEEVFDKILHLCAEQGMVGGHTQSIDAAHIKANASLDSLEKKEPKNSLLHHIKGVYQENDEDTNPHKYIQAEKKELNAIKKRQENFDKRMKKKTKSSLTNKTHYSPKDKDARLSRKQGTSLRLNYTSNISVDSEEMVITNIQADHSDLKDSQTLLKSIERTKRRLEKMNLKVKNILTDAGYSSGENYHILEEMNLNGYIPPHGKYKQKREGFTYEKESDSWLCSKGKRLKYVGSHNRSGIRMKRYESTKTDCRSCPIRTTCIGAKTFRKRIDVTIYKDEYDRMIEKIKSPKGRYYKYLRSSTVEPAFGTLKNYTGLRRINTIGIENAHKGMTLSAIAYNLKKYMKFIAKKKKLSLSAHLNPVLQYFYNLKFILL